MALNIPEPNSQPLNDFATRYRQEQDALLARQRQEQEGLFGQYEQRLGGQEKLPALYTRLQQEAGIPELQKQRQVFNTQIYGVKNMLDRLDEDVTSRTAGTMTTDAQRRRMIGAEGADLNNQLGRLGTGLQPIADMYGQASEQVGNLLNLNVQQQERELSPVTMRINALGERFAREITGFDNTRQQELNSILDKLNRERALADREWQRAAELAKQEAAFNQQKKLAILQFELNKQGGGGTDTATLDRKTWYGLTVGTARPPQLLAPAVGGAGSRVNLQGSAPKLQGSSGTYLQGSYPSLQGVNSGNVMRLQ